MLRWTFLAAIILSLASPLYGDSPRIKRLKKTASQVRGLSYKYNVKVGAKSKRQLQEFIMKEFKRELPPEKLFQMEKTFEAFGLIPEESDLRKILVDFYTNNVGGFYNPATKKLYIIKGSAGSSQGNEATIVHELIHSLQDQHYDLFALQKYVKNDDDRSSALSGLVEGEATLGMFYQQMRGTPAQQKFFVKFFQISTDISKNFIPVNRKVPNFIQDSMFFNYTQGLEFAWNLKKRGGMAQINKAYRDLPASTEQILHPEKYFAANRDDPWQIRFQGVGKLFPKKKGWKKVYENTMGELGIKILLREYLAYKKMEGRLGGLWKTAQKNDLLRGLAKTVAKYWTAGKVKKAAAGWGGDRYTIYYRPKDKTLSLVWYTQWDSRKDATEFYKAYKALSKMRKGEGKNSQTTSNVLKSGKKVLILQNIPRRKTVLLLQTLRKTSVKRLDRSKFKKEFPICQTVYSLRFAKKEEEKKKIRKKITALGKSAVPFLIGALDGEKKKAFLDEVSDLLKKITGKDFGRDYKKWSAWWASQKK